MRQIFSSLALSATLLVWGCSGPSDTPISSVERLAVPEQGYATSPRLSGDSGDVVLSWLVPGVDASALHYSRLTAGQWAPSVSVVDGVEMFVNWADLPSVVPLGDRRLAAHWLIQRPHNVYSYDVAFAQSADDGATWSSAMSPHDDGTPTEHGFVSIFPFGDQLGLIWLDGRKMANAHDAHDPAATGMTLRAGFIDAQLSLQGEQVIDEFICDCCQTDVAVSAAGPVAVYRDRTGSEIRDIYVARFVNGAWQTGTPVGDDNWNIDACPVNGPSVIADDSFVAVAWFTAADGPVVQVRTSTDSGETFGDAHDVVVGNTMGRVGLASLDDGDVAVSWFSMGDGGAEVLARRVSQDGSLGDVTRIASSAAGFSVPQLIRTGDDLIFAWTESADGEHRVVSARMPVAAL